MASSRFVAADGQSAKNGELFANIIAACTNQRSIATGTVSTKAESHLGLTTG